MRVHVWQRAVRVEGSPDCIGDLQYLSRILHVLQNQLKVYTLSLPGVLAYVTVALTSVYYVETPPHPCKHIVYSQLFDELKTT